MSLVLTDKQYPTYILTDPATNNYLELVPSRGGIVTSWVVQGQEVFYMDKERYADPKLSIRGGNPILFPICGNLPNNSYIYDGSEYKLNQHGFARNAVWEVVANTENAVTIALKNDDRTFEGYPFAFDLKITYSLSGNSLVVTQNCTNLSDRVMPFCLGFHPYFAVKNKASVAISISAQKLWNNVAQVEEDFSGKFDFSLPEVDSALYLDPLAREVVMTSDQGQLTVSFDENYRVFVVWALTGKDYICLEPWTAGRNAINTGLNLINLDPHTTKSMVVEYGYQKTWV